MYVFLTLCGLGYIISKSNNPHDTKHIPHLKKQPNKYNRSNIYESNILKPAQEYAKIQIQNQYKKGQNPHKTGVISSNYRDVVANNSKKTTYDSKLTGESIPIEEFKHNNMTPFFGGSVKQNVDLDKNVNDVVLEKYTGVGGVFHTEKNESLCFADIKDNIGRNIYGSEGSYEEQYNRIMSTKSKIKNNESPFDKELVGPGLNNGYESKPNNDGFHPDTREYALPKNVDELRSKNNPKLTFDGRMLSGQKGNKRGIQAPINKNKVDTFYENKPERYLKTTGAYTKEKYRPCHIVKDTNRKNSVSYSGNLYKNIGNEQSSKLQPTKKQKLEEFGQRNIDYSKWGQPDWNYGKDNILVYTNERDVTSTRTYEGNLTTLVKSLIAPVQDVFRATTKEYTVNNEREFGEMQTTFPSKQTIYDPNQVARTTIKETTIHDDRTGSVVGEKKSIVYDPNDVTRKTTRETLPDYENVINMKGGAKKQTIYDPDDPAKTTIRETTENSKRDGNINSLEGGGAYETNEYDVPNTNKQFTSDHEYMGTGPTKQNSDGYLNKEIQMQNTQKQLLSDNEHFGVAESTDKKQMSYQDIYNAIINDTKETTLQGRKPTLNNVKISNGGKELNVQFNKQDFERQSTRLANNINKIYDNPVSLDSINLTQERIDVLSDNINERLDPDILQAFHDNPYTKPLTYAV